VRHEALRQPYPLRLPRHYIPPSASNGQLEPQSARVELPRVSIASRKRSFVEVETTLSAEEAKCEAARCLRCDLEFTQAKN
jgi:hypothetical protein